VKQAGPNEENGMTKREYTETRRTIAMVKRRHNDVQARPARMQSQIMKDRWRLQRFTDMAFDL
jgi:hypothetical protein